MATERLYSAVPPKSPGKPPPAQQQHPAVPPSPASLSKGSMRPSLRTTWRPWSSSGSTLGPGAGGGGAARGAERQYRRRTPTVASAWVAEIVACMAGACMFIGIVVLLRYYDGRPEPALPLSATLNALLQLLITVAQFLAAMPIAHCLSQLKWLWFLPEARRLSDFQTYDDAVKGGVGSVKLLFTLRGGLDPQGLTTRIAAVMIVSAVLTGPVTQQVLAHRIILEPASNLTATVPRATLVSRSNGQDSNPSFSDMFDFRHALTSSAYLGPEKTVEQPNPLCPTADCEFETYGSMATCWDVVDATSTNDTTLLNNLKMATAFTVSQLYAQINSTALIPEGSRSIYKAGSFHTLVMPMAYPSLQFGAYATNASIAEVIVAYSDTWKAGSNATNMTGVDVDQFRYLIFSLSFCTQAFNSSVAAGVHRTNAVATTTQLRDPVPPGPPSLNWIWNNVTQGISQGLSATRYCPPQLVNQTVAFEAPLPLDGNDYVVDTCTGLLASSAIFGAVTGVAVQVENLEFLFSSGELSFPLSVSLYGTVDNRITDAETRMANVRAMVRNMADGLTTLTRQNGATFQGGGSGLVNGTALAPQTVVLVRWAWLSLLAAQVVGAAAILAATIAMTAATAAASGSGGGGGFADATTTAARGGGGPPGARRPSSLRSHDASGQGGLGVQSLKDSSIATLVALDADARAQLRDWAAADANNQAASSSPRSATTFSERGGGWAGMTRANTTTVEAAASSEARKMRVRLVQDGDGKALRLAVVRGGGGRGGGNGVNDMERAENGMDDKKAAEVAEVEMKE